jgi:hypothetical protein
MFSTGILVFIYDFRHLQHNLSLGLSNGIFFITNKQHALNQLLKADFLPRLL